MKIIEQQLAAARIDRESGGRGLDVTPPQGYELPAVHAEFFSSLIDISTDTESLLLGNEVREYQVRGVKKTADEMLSGVHSGVWEVGTGGGKTTMAMEFVARAKGKKLWLAPSKVALDRAVKDIKKLQALGYCQKVQILDAESGGFKNFDPDAEIVLMTGQMLARNERFMELAKHHFSLVVVDEGHGFLGDRMHKVPKHFGAYQIHMTATPDNANKDLYQHVPHQYFRYGSDELVTNDGFPEWILHRYEVENENLDEAKAVGDYLDVEGKEGKILNMPHRFSIARKILLKALKAGEKAICFMPSITSSKIFIEMLLGNEEKGKPCDPEFEPYKNQLAHVDGDTPNRRGLEEQFQKGEMMAVCCNTVWNESLDVCDIQHVILCDVCLSPRILMQRIGRGARKAEGKNALHIHDVVSGVRRVRRGGKGLKSNEAKRRMPVTVAKVYGLENVADGEVLNGPNRGKVFDETIAEYVDRTVATSRHVSFHERDLDLNLLQDMRHAEGVLGTFQKVTGVHAINLLANPKAYAAAKVTIDDELAGRKTEISFADFMEAMDYFGLLEELRGKLMAEIQAIRQKVQKRAQQAAAMQVSGPDKGAEKLPQLKDPFAPGRENEMATLCCRGDRSDSIKAFKYISECVRKANPSATEIAIPLSSFERVLGSAYACFYDCNRPDNPRDSYDLVGQCLMNNWFVHQEGRNIIVEIKQTRDFWKEAEKGEKPEFILKTSKTKALTSKRPHTLEPAMGKEKYARAITLSDSAAKAIEAALKKGEDFIFIPATDDLDRDTSDILAIMGMATYASDGNYNDGITPMGPKNYPRLLMKIETRSDGWRVPIGHVKLAPKVTTDPANLRKSREAISKRMPKFTDERLQYNLENLMRDWIQYGKWDDCGRLTDTVEFNGNDRELTEFTATMRLYGVTFEIVVDDRVEGERKIMLKPNLDGVLTGQPWKPSEPGTPQAYPVNVPEGGMEFLAELLEFAREGENSYAYAFCLDPGWEEDWEVFSKKVDFVRHYLRARGHTGDILRAEVEPGECGTMNCCLNISGLKNLITDLR